MFSKRFSIVVLLIFTTLMVSTYSFALAGTVPATEGNTDKNTIKVGMDDCYIPMEYKDAKGNRAGFDIDLANAIGKKLGMKIEFVSTSWDGIFAALNNKKFDCIISSVNLTEERKKRFQCSAPYIEYGQIIITKKSNSNIKNTDGLSGKKVGVQIGTSADDLCNTLTNSKKIKVTEYDSIDNLVAALKKGKVNAILCDELVGRYFVTQNKNDLKVVGNRLTKEQIGIFFNSEDLKNKVNKSLNDLRKDGTLKKISIKWFGADLTNCAK